MSDVSEHKEQASGQSVNSEADSQTPRPNKKLRNTDTSPLLSGEGVEPDPLIVIMNELRLVREEMREGREEMRLIREEVKESRKFSQEIKENVTKELEIMNTKIKCSMTEVANKMKKEVINEVKEELKKELKKQDSKFDNIHKKIEKQNGDILKTQRVVESLSNDIVKQNEKLIKMQKEAIDKDARARQLNLMFYGIKETEKEDTVTTIKNFIKNDMKIQESINLSTCKRVGPPRSKDVVGSKHNSPRPIVATFVDFKQKESVKKESYNLKSPYGCSQDLPLVVRRARQSLNAEFKILKDQKKNVTIMYPARIVDLSTHETLREADISKFFETDK